MNYTDRSLIDPDDYHPKHWPVGHSPISGIIFRFGSRARALSLLAPTGRALETRGLDSSRHSLTVMQAYLAQSSIRLYRVGQKVGHRLMTTIM